MKLFKTLSFLLLMGIGLGTHAQHKHIYLSNDKVIHDPKKADSYALYGKLELEGLWAIKVYDLYDQLTMTGSYLDEELAVPHGQFTYYLDLYEFNKEYKTNFKLKGQHRFVYQQGTFENGAEVGEWRTYYPNGSVFKNINYVNGEMHGKYLQYHVNGTVDVEGQYVEGKKEGTWILFEGLRTQLYENDVMISQTKSKAADRREKRMND